MNLERDALGDVFWPVANIPSDYTNIELQLGYNTTWYPLTVVSPTTVSAYMAGPDAASPGAAIVVSSNVNCRIRVRNAHYNLPVTAFTINLVNV